MTSPIIQLPNAEQNSNPIVRALEDALAQARAGRLAAVGVVTVSSMGSINAAAGGTKLGDVYIGADILKGNLMNAFMGTRPTLAS